MRAEILNLEKLSRLLEPTADERENVRIEVVNYTEDFLTNIEKTKAYKSKSYDSKLLLYSPITDRPAPIGKLIQLLRKSVDSPRLNPASGGHLGYIPGGGLYYSALGDYMADVFNRYAGLFSAGPGAVRMENMLIQWMAKIVGYPRNAAGNLTTGGSLANLMAIVTARENKRINSANVERSVIYLSAQVNHSVFKAIRIAGLKECHVQLVPIDKRYRIIASELEKQIERDKRQNLNPFLVIASAGTTNAGTIDPLEGISIVCRKHRLWYHVDAAYGGFFILTEKGKEKLRGIELADSLTIDPHKGLFLPYGLGVILVKDKKALEAACSEKVKVKKGSSTAQSYQPDYMPLQKPNEPPSPAYYSAELTKHFRGLRLWLPLKLYGVKPFRACLEEKLLLAKYFHREIRKLGFKVGPEPELSVATYRYIPKHLADDLVMVDKFNKSLLKAVNNDGRVFISSTKLDGKVVLRLACLSFRTHLTNIDMLIQILKEKTDRLLATKYRQPL